jgi:ATP/maltotriose-dependent transcriptional regulator MalT
MPGFRVARRKRGLRLSKLLVDQNALDNLDVLIVDLHLPGIQATGSATAEAANVLGISVETLRMHIKNIYKKYGVHNRVQLMQKINEDGRTDL